MQEYSIALALEDFLPVIFSAIGLFILANMIRDMDDRCAPMAYMGAALITLGGLSKASWKLIYAVTETQTNITLLDNALFFCLAPGFILITFALWHSQRTVFEQKQNANIWRTPLIIAGVTVLTGIMVGMGIYDETREGRQIWFFILLGMTTIFNFVALGLAIRQALKQRVILAAILFGVNLFAIIAMQGLARSAEQTEALQWIAQGVNTVSQLGFIFAASLLARVYREGEWFNEKPVKQVVNEPMKEAV